MFHNILTKFVKIATKNYEGAEGRGTNAQALRKYGGSSLTRMFFLSCFREISAVKKETSKFFLNAERPR